MTAPILVLLPPSEAKTPGGTKRTSVGTFDAALGDDRRRVIDALIESLETATTRRREIMLNARGPLMERALEATMNLRSADVALLPAWQRYSGVVWSHLAATSLAPTQRRRILIPTSLYGLTTAEDRIADFRLKMNIGVGELGTMASFWRPKVTESLVAHARRSTIINLLPLEHEATIDMAALARARRVVRVQFIDAVGGNTVGHDAKAVKGTLARTLLVEGLDALESFRWQGWHSISVDDEIHVLSPAVRATEGWVTKRKNNQYKDLDLDLT